MRKILLTLMLLSTVSLYAADMKMKISKRYMCFPVSHQSERRMMRLIADGREQCHFVIRLAQGEPDYWVFRDVNEWKGKVVTLSYDGDKEALQLISQGDTWPGQDSVYAESLRPRYHFTTQRGWINDPNGLVYDRTRGEYHLFYQHNPYEREWENMHWGHAVSTDMLHWKELPDALHPDSIGTMFSGSALMDYDNAAGFNIPARKDKHGRIIEPEQVAMIVYYTADSPEAERQCMAYSLDGGRTFTKYPGNPVIDSHKKWQSHDTRDPKIFKYADHHYVLVLNERDGNTIYRSSDLKTWQAVSHITGFWECPELFPLSNPQGDNPTDSLWVMWGASGTYMLGHFDGETFTPSSPKQINSGGTAYAAQCFNCLDSSEKIKIAWGRISFPNMPFNGCMLLPQRQELRSTPSGPRLYSRPIESAQKLFTQVFSGGDMSMHEANQLLQQYADDDALRLRATLHLTYATDASLHYRGQPLFAYDMNSNRLQGDFYVNPWQPGAMDIDLDVFIDGTIVEAFVDEGAFSYSLQLSTPPREQRGYEFRGNSIEIKRLQIYRLREGESCRVK